MRNKSKKFLIFKLTLKLSCIIGSTCTWAACQSVVMRRPISSDSRQHMVLYLSLDKHTLEPNTSDTARRTGGTGTGKKCYLYIHKELKSTHLDLESSKQARQSKEISYYW